MAKKIHQEETTYVYSEIVRQIATGQLSPGQRLVEKALAESFDMSRTPIREVLFKLERDGLVQRTRNQGARVTAFTPDDIEQIYEIRSALECLAVRGAVNNLKLNQLFELERQLEEWRNRTGPDRYKALYEVDLHLHALIISHSGNPRLTSYLERLSLLINSIRLLTHGSEEHFRAGVEEHLGIIRALTARNGPLAEKLLGEHIRAAQRRAIEFFKHTTGNQASPEIAKPASTVMLTDRKSSTAD